MICQLLRRVSVGAVQVCTIKLQKRVPFRVGDLDMWLLWSKPALHMKCFSKHLHIHPLTRHVFKNTSHVFKNTSLDVLLSLLNLHLIWIKLLEYAHSLRALKVNTWHGLTNTHTHALTDMNTHMHTLVVFTILSRTVYVLCFFTVCSKLTLYSHTRYIHFTFKIRCIILTQKKWLKLNL